MSHPLSLAGNSESRHASTTVNAPAEAVFAVLADPSAHSAIDGTGWVRESLQDARITATGQVFRMAVYHPNHPDKDYKMANCVGVFDEPLAIEWQPGTESPEPGNSASAAGPGATTSSQSASRRPP